MSKSESRQVVYRGPHRETVYVPDSDSDELVAFEYGRPKAVPADLARHLIDVSPELFYEAGKADKADRAAERAAAEAAKAAADPDPTPVPGESKED